MPKFTFIGEHVNLHGKPDGTKVTYECNVEALDSILEHMEMFIKGCGYLPNGVLDFVETELNNPYSNIPDEKYEHSEHYFDKERNR